MLTKLLNFVALVCFAIAIAFIFTVHLAQKKPSNNPSNYLKIKSYGPRFSGDNSLLIRCEENSRLV